MSDAEPKTIDRWEWESLDDMMAAILLEEVPIPFRLSTGRSSALINQDFVSAYHRVSLVKSMWTYEH